MGVCTLSFIIALPPTSERRRLLDALTTVLDGSGAVKSCSIVGSMSPVSEERVVGFADYDVLLLVDDYEDAIRFEQALRVALADHAFAGTIVRAWGVVGKTAGPPPLVHLLADPVWAFARRSALLRYSLAKYPPLHGTALADYGPRHPPTLEVLQRDRLGPVALLDKLRRHDYRARGWERDPGGWQLRSLRSPVASEVDFALYAALHSARNVLRHFNAYPESTATSALPELMARENRDVAHRLGALVAAKLRLRVGDSAVASDPGVRSAALDLLEDLRTWCGLTMDWDREAEASGL